MRLNARLVTARSKQGSRRQVYAPRPSPGPSTSEPCCSWKRRSSACGALRPQPAQVRTGLPVLAGLSHDRNAAVWIVLDMTVMHVGGAGLEGLILARQRRIARAGRELLGLGVS